MRSAFILKIMNQTKFKTLMHCGHYVDVNLLEQGIYTTTKPYLYNCPETIEDLIEKGRQMKFMTGVAFLSESYFENISKCKLVDVQIVVQADA
jgi:hypothetical protein